MSVIYYYQNPKGVEFATPNIDFAVSRAAYFGTSAYQKEKLTNSEEND
jgi:hypothetical protein